jgi:hypothetical protein
VEPVKRLANIAKIANIANIANIGLPKIATVRRHQTGPGFQCWQFGNVGKVS